MTKVQADRGALAPTPQWVLIACALVFHWYKLWPYTKLEGYDFDAIHLYFPLAHGLLAQGISFLAEEQSLQAPPFSYIYTALVGLDLDRLRMVNAVLSGFTLVLAARTAQLAHSPRAGVLAAVLFALSPLLRPFLATPITEPPYLLLCAVWIWTFFEWLGGRSAAFLFVSAFALTLAALTRATMFYWAILMTAVFAAAWWRGPLDIKTRARLAAIAYGAALALPALLIVKNLMLFHFGFYATGGGNALYLGNNPLTGGYDSPMLGLRFDVGSIARDQSHLTLEAERLLGGVGKYIIFHSDPVDLAWRHLRKLGAFLFASAAQGDANTLRAWRVGLMLFGAVGVAAIRSRAMRWTLAWMLVYQIIVHVPVLYTLRYSVGAIDLWLVILAAIGLASLLPRERWAYLAAMGVVTVLAIQVGRWLLKHQGPPQPDVFAAARILMWESPAREYVADNTGAPLELTVRHGKLPFDKSMNFVLVVDAKMAVNAEAAGCSALHSSYRRRTDSDFGRPVERVIRGSDRKERIEIGGEFLNLNDEGVLRLAMKCKKSATMRFERISVYAPVGSIDFRERYLGERPLFPGLLEK